MKINSNKVFDVVNLCIMAVLLFIFTWPLWFVLIASFSEPRAVYAGEVVLFPKGWTLFGYEKVLHYKQLWVGYANTIFYTVAGTIANMIMSICMAYPMSEKSFKPRKFLMGFFMVSMYFGGGLIPTYLLMRDLGLVNTRAIMILSGMISIYNSLIIRSYFMNSIPGELKEASFLDGANAAQYLVKVVLPLSKPVFAVVALYYMVGHWNNYTTALYYIYKDDYYPLQNILREMLNSSKFDEALSADPEEAERAYQTAQSMKYCAIILSSVPMLCVYPFIQKHFVKGVMVGSIKG